MFIKISLLAFPLIVLNLITIDPVKSQNRCPYQNYMIGTDSNCINLDELQQKKSIPNQKTPSVLQNQEAINKSKGGTTQETPKSPEEIELTYAIKEKQNNIEFIEKDNEKMAEQIKISCAKLTNFDQRKFCLEEKKRLEPQIEENKERISSLEKEIKDLKAKLNNLSDLAKNK